MKKKIAIVALLISSILSSITLSADSNIQGTGTINITSTVSSSEIPQSDEDKSFTTVDWEKSSTFSVTLPKLITLSTEATAQYFVQVKGDISSNTNVVVIPDTNVTLKDVSGGLIAKSDIIGDISQEKDTFEWNEINIVDSNNDLIGTRIGLGVDDDCTIVMRELKAGDWEGKFYWNISCNYQKFSNVTVIDDDTEANLNGVLTRISGSKRTELLNELQEQQNISDDELNNIIDLVEINCDDFDNTARLEADVSNTLNNGDIVAIYHYNESEQKWEYLGTSTVTDGKIIKSFSSFSPILFMKHTHNFVNNICAECGEYGDDWIILTYGMNDNTGYSYAFNVTYINYYTGEKTTAYLQGMQIGGYFKKSYSFKIPKGSTVEFWRTPPGPEFTYRIQSGTWSGGTYDKNNEAREILYTSNVTHKYLMADMHRWSYDAYGNHIVWACNTIESDDASWFTSYSWTASMYGASNLTDAQWKSIMTSDTPYYTN